MPMEQLIMEIEKNWLYFDQDVFADVITLKRVIKMQSKPEHCIFHQPQVLPEQQFPEFLACMIESSLSEEYQLGTIVLTLYPEESLAGSKGMMGIRN